MLCVGGRASKAPVDSAEALKRAALAVSRRTSDLGDRGWGALLDRHNEAVRKELARFRGREVKTLGDGFLATCDGPARAVPAPPLFPIRYGRLA